MIDILKKCFNIHLEIKENYIILSHNGVLSSLLLYIDIFQISIKKQRIMVRKSKQLMHYYLFQTLQIIKGNNKLFYYIPRWTTTSIMTRKFVIKFHFCIYTSIHLSHSNIIQDKLVFRLVINIFYF